MGPERLGLVDLRYSSERELVELLEDDHTDLLAGLMLSPGDDFLKWVARYLQESLDVDYAFVGAISGEDWQRIQTLHISRGSETLENFVYDLQGTPCAVVMDRDICYCCAQVSAAFPDDQMLTDMGLEAYVGIALLDPQGIPLGIAVVLNKEPISEAKARAVSARLRVLRARLEIELLQRVSSQSMLLASSVCLTSTASLEHLLTSLAKATQARAAFVAEPAAHLNIGDVLDRNESELLTLALCVDGVLAAPRVLSVSGTLLAERLPEEGLIITDGLLERCAATASITNVPARSYLGYQVLNAEDQLLGQVGLLHDRPLPDNLLARPIIRVLLTRIGGELHRLEFEKRNTMLTRRMLDAEHRESIGDLASGIAHDFNNILFAISGQAHLVDRIYRDNPSLHEEMSVILDACEQAGGLCNQLLIYAGRQPSKVTTIDLNEVVLGCQRIANIFTKSASVINYDLSPAPIIMQGSLTHLQQIAMNLLKNAADAVPLGGQIDVVTRVQDCVAADFDGAILGEQQVTGRFAVLQIQDNGTGIAPIHMRRIFMPLFTTKDAGHGMGLAVVMGGAKEHGAAIFVKSVPDEGTCFQIYFPLGPG